MKTVQEIINSPVSPPEVFFKAEAIDDIRRREAMQPAPAEPVIDRATIDRLRKIKTALESTHAEAVGLDAKTARGQAAISPLRQQIVEKAAGLDWEDLTDGAVAGYVKLNAQFDVLRLSLARAPSKRARLVSELQDSLHELEGVMKSLNRFDSLRGHVFSNPNHPLLEIRVRDGIIEIQKLLAQVS